MKTAFERYIEANNALAKCYQGTSVDQWKALSASQQEGLCKAERDAVTGFLASNQVTFANIIKERLQAAGHQ
jgi:hypothetical protein